MSGEAYCTLLLTGSYERGAIVLGHRLAQIDSNRDRIVLVTPEIAPDVRHRLATVYTHIVEVPPLKLDAHAELKLLGRPDLVEAPTKLHVWKLPYSKVVYLDADTLPIGGPNSLDPLFEALPSQTPGIAAAPDVGWPDCFNSGVFVAAPSEKEYQSLLNRASQPQTSFDGSDQGLLNEHFDGRWHRVPFIYNVTLANSYQYAPAFAKFKANIRVLHFIGASKPWTQAESSPQSSSDGPVSDMYNLWKAAESEAFPDTQAQSDTGVYDSNKVIEPSVDHWDAASHAPFKDTPPEGGDYETYVTTDDEQFVYPTYGPSVVKLPYEDAQERPERIF